MADYSYKTPFGRDAGFMIGTVDAPGSGTTDPTYSIIAGDPGGYFTIGPSNGVLEIAQVGYEVLTYPLDITVQRTDDAGSINYTVEIDRTGLLLDKSPIMYVDPVNGNNASPGTMSLPVSSVDLAYYRLMGGGAILLYDGQCGSRSFAGKPFTMKGLRGYSPVFDDIEIEDGISCVIENANLTSTGITTLNTTGRPGGSFMVRGCLFEGTSAINCQEYRYASIVQNVIKSGTLGISLAGIEEANVLSNTIYGESSPMTLAVSTSSVDRLDFLHNTVYNADEIYFDDAGALATYGVTYITMTPAILSAEQIVFPGSGFLTDSFGNPAVAINHTEGATQEYGVDFTVVANVIDWSGLGMGADLEVGDILRIQYELLGGVSSGKLEIDSSSLTDITNINFTSGLFATINYNNTFNSTVGATLNGTNISADPLYTNTAGGDFSLQDGSPNRKVANPNGVGLDYNSVPYQQDQDINKANRSGKGEVADIGSTENLSDVNTRTDPELHIGQQGYDVVYNGDEARPLKRLSRAFDDASGDPILLDFGATTPNVSDRKMFMDDSSIETGAGTVSINNPQTQIPYISRRDSAFIQTFDPADYSGVHLYISQDGDDTDGDGTFSNPFRTVEKAFTAGADVVYVIAGSYPLFDGVPGKKIVFLPRNDLYLQGAFLDTTTLQTAWSVQEFGGSTYSFGNSSFQVSHP